MVVVVLEVWCWVVAVAVAWVVLHWLVVVEAGEEWVGGTEVGRQTTARMVGEVSEDGRPAVPRLMTALQLAASPPLADRHPRPRDCLHALAPAFDPCFTATMNNAPERVTVQSGQQLPPKLQCHCIALRCEQRHVLQAFAVPRQWRQNKG